MIRFPKLLLALVFVALIGLSPASASDLTAEQIIEL